jgi:hypothetical protein
VFTLRGNSAAMPRTGPSYSTVAASNGPALKPEALKSMLDGCLWKLIVTSSHAWRHSCRLSSPISAPCGTASVVPAARAWASRRSRSGSSASAVTDSGR